MGPIDYTVDVQSPFQAAMQGLQLGSALDQAAALNQVRQQQIEQAQIATQAAADQQERQRQLNAALMGLRQNPNPTGRDFVDVAMLLPEKEAESMRANFGLLDEDRKQAELRFAGQVISAINSGKTDIAKRLIELRASGETDPRQKKAWNDWRSLIDQSPETAAEMGSIMLASLPGGGDLLESVAKARRAPAEQQLVEAQARSAQVEADIAPAVAQAQVADIESRIAERADRLNLDRDQVAMEAAQRLQELSIEPGVELDTHSRTLINNAATESVTASASANQLEDLARRIQAMGGGLGGATSISDAFGRLTGQQGAWEQTRQEYIRLRNSLAMDSLPPGPATDKDIELAMQGFPPETANAEALSTFLTGMAKMQRLNGMVEDAKAEWVANIGSLAPASDAISVGGVDVPAGETFPKFITRFVNQIQGDIAKRAEQAQSRRDAAMIERLKQLGTPQPQQPQPPQAPQPRRDRPLFSPNVLGRPQGSSTQVVR